MDPERRDLIAAADQNADELTPAQIEAVFAPEKKLLTDLTNDLLDDYEAAPEGSLTRTVKIEPVARHYSSPTW